jgi:ribosomal protein L29
MKIKLQELSMEELNRAMHDARIEIRMDRFKSVTSKVDNPKKIRENRKLIARILTLKREYALGIKTPKAK